jgi:hypothetical protein
MEKFSMICEYLVGTEFNSILSIIEKRIPQLKREYSKGLIRDYSDNKGKSVKYIKNENYENVKFLYNKEKYFIPVGVYSEIYFSIYENYDKKIIYFKITNLLNIDLKDVNLDELSKNIILSANKMNNFKYSYTNEIIKKLEEDLSENDLNEIFHNINKKIYEFNTHLEENFNIKNFL